MILRTPEERFQDLPEYPFEPHYVTVGGMRMHYVDEGPADADPVLMLHGEPSWSYLYRKMIVPVASAGHRAIAPDLIGFGRSDKPAQRSAYTYQAHVDWMTEFILALNLRNITMFCQDWGGGIGLRVLADHSERFARVVVANTALPTGDQSLGKEFLEWLEYTQNTPDFNVGKMIAGACKTRLSPEVIKAYDAPFPDDTYKAGARVFPALVPATREDPARDATRAAWKRLRQLQLPFLCAFSDGDPITRGAEQFFIKMIPGCKGQAHTTIEGGGHFLQEDKGEQLGALINEFIATAN